jgi:hypothetical protein
MFDIHVGQGVPNPAAFAQEYHQHGKNLIRAEIVLNLECGTYRWRCPHCRLSWVSVGSAMDVANEIAFANCVKDRNGDV